MRYFTYLNATAPSIHGNIYQIYQISTKMKFTIIYYVLTDGADVVYQNYKYF